MPLVGAMLDQPCPCTAPRLLGGVWRGGGPRVLGAPLPGCGGSMQRCLSTASRLEKSWVRHICQH
jgi:hypothetical protein